MMKKNQSNGLTETDCSRQMGRYKRMIVRQIILCLHKGWRRMLKDGTRWLINRCGWLGLKHQPTNCFRYDQFRRHISSEHRSFDRSWEKGCKGMRDKAKRKSVWDSLSELQQWLCWWRIHSCLIRLSCHFVSNTPNHHSTMNSANTKSQINFVIRNVSLIFVDSLPLSALI